MRFLSPLRIVKWVAIFASTLLIIQLYFMVQENHEKSKLLKLKYRSWHQNENISHPLTSETNEDGEKKSGTQSLKHETVKFSEEFHLAQDAATEQSKLEKVEFSFIYIGRAVHHIILLGNFSLSLIFNQNHVLLF